MADLFTTAQLETLRAVMNCMIPPDDYPGGWDAGVGDYLMRQLNRGDLARLLNTYRAGLSALDVEASAVFGVRFCEADATAQEKLLTQIEHGYVQTPWPVNPQGFVLMLAEHCAEGYYSDPGNGGNHSAVSWGMVGFEVRG